MFVANTNMGFMVRFIVALFLFTGAVTPSYPEVVFIGIAAKSATQTFKISWSSQKEW